MSEFIAQYDDNEVKPSPLAKEELVEAQNKAEQKEEVLDKKESKPVQTETKIENPIEEAARGQGWVPQEEWD